MEIKQINEYDKVIILNDREIENLCADFIERGEREIERYLNRYFDISEISEVLVDATLPQYPHIIFELYLEHYQYQFKPNDEYGVGICIDVDGRFTKKPLFGKDKLIWKHENREYDYYLSDESYAKIVKYFDDNYKKIGNRVYNAIYDD